MIVDKAIIEDEITEQRLARADIYSMLSAFLMAPLSDGQIAWLAQVGSSTDRVEDSLSGCWQSLSDAASEADVQAESTEFYRLFIGMSGGVLTPYASVYLTGTMFAAPLVNLRNELKRQGISFDEERSEPEDHLSSIFDVIAFLLSNDDLDTAKRLARDYLQPWAEKFADDMAAQAQTALYSSAGVFLKKFLQQEFLYFFRLSDQ